LVLALVSCGLGLVSCHEKKGVAEDPLKDKAREKYAEGRRLFLTCDPNNYSEAQRLFEESLAYWDDYPEANAAWAETISMWYSFLIPQELFEQAYMRAQRAVRLDPNLDMGYRAMADLFRHHRDEQTGEYQTRYALDVIERALKIAPNSAENLYVKGSIYLAVDPQKAVEILNQARAVNPDLGKTYFNLSSAHQMMAEQLTSKHGKDPQEPAPNQDQIVKNYDKAIEYLKTYQKLVPGDLGGYCSLGTVYLLNRNVAEAEKMFQKTVSVSQKADISQNRWKIVAYYKLAEIAGVNNKDLGAARLYLERALELAPKNAQTLSQLAHVCAAQKDDKAASDYKKRLEQSIQEMKAATEQHGSTAEKNPAPGAGGTLEKVPAPAEGGTGD
jgi:tetratricopeptide (TPR) repeat protein